MNISIQKDLVKKGVLVGAPCIKVLIPENEDYNEAASSFVVDSIFKMGLRHVNITGNLKLHPIIKQTIAGLSSKGYLVTFTTTGDDSIGPLRIFKNVKFVLNVVPPNVDTNNVLTENLTLLKEDDEFCFLISKKEEYADAKTFLKGRTITRPLVLFVLLQSALGSATEDIKKEYLEDCVKFKFKNRIQVI